MSASLGAALRFLNSLSLRTCSPRAVPSGGQPSKAPGTAETAGVPVGTGTADGEDVAAGLAVCSLLPSWPLQPPSETSRATRVRNPRRDRAFDIPSPVSAVVAIAPTIRCQAVSHATSRA